MDIRDILIVAGALALVILIALVMKPLITGTSPDLTAPSFPSSKTEIPVPPSPLSDTPVATMTEIMSSTPEPTPSPPSTWNGSNSEMELVDPSQYDVTLKPDFVPRTLRQEEYESPAVLATYMRIDGTMTGTTETFRIPFPYWEIWYSADPLVPPAGGDTTVQTSLFPSFSIKVMEGNQTNRVVREISPPGGLDTNLWKEDKDPRPWSAKIFEGNKYYYMIIARHAIKNYWIEIRVPERFIGMY